jgi:CRP-like cAMP-binding protein
MSEVLVRLLFEKQFVEGQYWQRRHYKAMDYVIHEGERSKDVFVILAGSVRVLGNVKLENDKTMRPGISDLTTGAVFGELALFEDTPRTASVQAIEDSELAVIDGDKLLHYMEEHPDVGYQVLLEFMGTQAGRLRTANKRVASLLAWGMKGHAIDSSL